MKEENAITKTKAQKVHLGISNPYFMFPTASMPLKHLEIIVYVHPYSLLSLLTRAVRNRFFSQRCPIGSTEWPLIVFPAPFVKGTEKNK